MTTRTVAFTVTFTRPNLDIPWYGTDADSSTERKTNLATINAWYQNLLGSKRTVNDDPTSLVATVVFANLTDSELEFMDVMTSNIHSELTPLLNDMLSYYQANNVSVVLT